MSSKVEDNGFSFHGAQRIGQVRRYRRRGRGDRRKEVSPRQRKRDSTVPQATNAESHAWSPVKAKQGVLSRKNIAANDSGGLANAVRSQQSMKNSGAAAETPRKRERAGVARKGARAGVGAHGKVLVSQKQQWVWIRFRQRGDPARAPRRAVGGPPAPIVVHESRGSIIETRGGSRAGRKARRGRRPGRN